MVNVVSDENAQKNSSRKKIQNGLPSVVLS
jgi:hypothetical protein